MLSSPFFRNQTAYVVGRIVNGINTYAFVVPVKHDADGKLYLDAVLTDDADLAFLFSANRAYFLVDMEVPSAYVAFLQALLPDKTAAELYTMVGIAEGRQEPVLPRFPAPPQAFARQVHHRARHQGTRDERVHAAVVPVRVQGDQGQDRGVEGHRPRQQVKDKYTLVKHHDRVGRMTDILEYSNVAFPRERFSEELIAELVAVAPSVVEFETGRVIVKHLYIERRMTPLNLYLERADDAQRMHAMREYGNALKELAAVNIFAGDLLFKNFGVTRFGRVVFYDYDEIDFLTDCKFRRIPQPPPGYDEMSDEVWYPVGPKDIFPEEFATFLLTDAKTRECFMYYHADLLASEWWQAMQREIRSGRLVEVLSYTDVTRFGHSRRGNATLADIR